MATDIRLDDDPSEQWVTVDAAVLNVAGADLMLDSQARRSGNAGGYRRALVHSDGDSLTVNYNNDYTGGVAINDLRLNLRPRGPEALSKDGNVGDLVLVREVNRLGNQILSESVTLWLCIGPGSLRLDTRARWVPVSTGEPVEGV